MENIIGEKVKHSRFGCGVVKEFNGEYITVAFEKDVKELKFPEVCGTSSFKKMLHFLNEERQMEVEELLAAEKQAKNEKEAIKKAECKKDSTVICSSIGAQFSKNFHAEYLMYESCLSYLDVEKERGINIAAFGRGINVRQNEITLISILHETDYFVYHDCFDVNGDYIFSGEGQHGDQVMKRGNLSLRDAKLGNKKILLYVKFSPQKYYYQGEFEVVDIFTEIEKDIDGKLRNEYKFRLRKV